MKDMELEYILKNLKESEIDFRAVYDLTIDQVFSYVFLRTKDKEWSKEICQEIYLSLWKSLPKFKYISKEHFFGFLFTVVRRQIIKARIKNKPAYSLEEIYDVADEEEKKEDYRFMLKQIDSLKEKERLTLELRYFKNMTFSEISQILNIKEGNAKVLHHRALEKLRQSLPEYEI